MPGRQKWSTVAFSWNSYVLTDKFIENSGRGMKRKR